MTRNSWAAVPCLLILLAGHHQALAGETLYSPGFTHTWAIFPLSLLALYLFFRDLHVMAFLLVGVIFNFHALEAGHLVLIMGFAAVCDIKKVGFGTLVLGTGLFLLAALPTILLMITQRQHLSGPAFEQWLQLMHIRSADHSFPSSWWKPDTPDIPRFACVMGLAAVALSFRLPPRMKKRALLLAGGVGILFVAGTVFTEVIPLPLAIRAQFFRSSRLLFVLALIVIGNGCALALGMPWRKMFSREPGAGFPMYEGPSAGKLLREIPAWHAWLEFASALLTLACLAIPPGILPLPLALLPVALLVALVVALTSGRLAWYEALFAGAALMVCVVAYQTIRFVLPGTSSGEMSSLVMLNLKGLPGAAGWGLLVVAGLLAAVATRRKQALPMLLAALTGGTVLALGGLAALVPAMARNAEPAPLWAEAQRWARSTPVESIFLTPTQENNFRLYSWRVYSQRAVVGEWRDGTQLYFSSDFAKDWWDRMNDEQPGMVKDASGKGRINRGKSLDQQDDETIVKLAKKYNASYIVLPTSDQHYLVKAYSNPEWTVYKPEFVTPNDMPTDASLPEENKFLMEKALPNIEKIRKSNAQISIVDAGGKPVTTEYTITQTSSAFGFGASMSFFKEPNVDTKADYKPPQVTAAEQAKFLELFNYSVIPFSGQWRFMEPDQGKIDYTDLDLYVNWCVKNGVRPEFRFVAGYQPAWMRNKVSSDQSLYIVSRAETLARHYGTRIMDWQVTSEEIGVKSAAPVFAALRKALPTARLGISDDTRFWSVRPGTQGTDDMQRGLDTLKDLKKQGVKVDFFAMEAKHPLGLWASGKQIYDLLDTYAKEGVKIHVTEFGVAIGDRIEGTVREGTWTDKLQADYYERFFTILYSHPAVEAVNIMGIGPKTWVDRQGLLDDNYEPTAAYKRLKELIGTRWSTKLTQKPSNGQVSFRGYQGKYEISVTLADGKVATGTFDVVDTSRSGVVSGANTIQLVVDAATGTLKKVGDR